MSDMFPMYPFREMEELSNLMDRLWGSSMGSLVRRESPNRWSMPLNVVETGETFVIEASLPGVKPEDIEITFSDNTLTMQCEVKQAELKEGEQYHLRERRFGKFSRSLTLPTCVNPDLIEAIYTAGVLRLQLPKAEEVKPKRITVQQAKKGKMIDGKFENIANKN